MSNPCTAIAVRHDTTLQVVHDPDDSSPTFSYSPGWKPGFARQAGSVDQTLHATKLSNSTITFNITGEHRQLSSAQEGAVFVGSVHRMSRTEHTPGLTTSIDTHPPCPLFSKLHRNDIHQLLSAHLGMFKVYLEFSNTTNIRFHTLFSLLPAFGGTSRRLEHRADNR